MRGRLGGDFGWVGWGRYGLLRNMAGNRGGVVDLLVGSCSVARYPSKAGLLWLICVGRKKCRVVRVLVIGTGRV